MKKRNWFLILLIAVSGTTVSVSCKNKKVDSTTQENKTQPTENKVEISSDDGEACYNAKIPNPGTKLSWSLWSYQWTPDEEGEIKLVVRATDGEGKLQISEYRDQVPDGATGLHRVRAIVEKA